MGLWGDPRQYSGDAALYSAAFTPKISHFDPFWVIHPSLSVSFLLVGREKSPKFKL